MTHAKKQNLWQCGFDASPARIDDDFLHRQIQMYRARAQILQFASWVLLFITTALIVAGIITFFVGDPGDDVLAEEEVNLRVDAKSKQDEINDLDNKVARTNEKLSTLERAKVLASVLRNLKSGVAGLQKNPTSGFIESLKSKTLPACTAIIKTATQNKIAAQETIIISGSVIGDSDTFPQQAIKILKAAAIKETVDFSQLDGELNKLSEELGTIQNNAVPNESGEFSPETMESFNLTIGAFEHVGRLDAVYQNVHQQAKDAGTELQKIEERETARQKERQRLEKEKSEIERELTETRHKREKILFMAWIPGLTLRVGTVVLLLFLTQILLATYRYTIGLSAFYLARSDAIQLVQASADDATTYRIEELAILMGLLTPNEHKVDFVKDPSQYLAELAKTYITRTPPTS